MYLKKAGQLFLHQLFELFAAQGCFTPLSVCVTVKHCDQSLHRSLQIRRHCDWLECNICVSVSYYITKQWEYNGRMKNIMLIVLLVFIQEEIFGKFIVLLLSLRDWETVVDFSKWTRAKECVMPSMPKTNKKRIYYKFVNTFDISTDTTKPLL